MSNGIPTVMSKLSAGSFRLSNKSNSTCVGGDIESFKDCVISMYENEDKWNSIQKGGFEFIRQTHSLEFVQSKWKRLIDQSMNIAKDLRYNVLSRTFSNSEKCLEGEKLYLKMYPYVKGLLEDHSFTSAFEHWVEKGKSDGMLYYDCDDNQPHGLFETDMEQFQHVQI